MRIHESPASTGSNLPEFPSTNPRAGLPSSSTLPPCRARISPIPLSITIRKLSDLTGISIRHLYRLDAAGLIPGKFKCGRLSRYKFSVIKEWIRSGMDPNFTEEQADAEEFLFDQLLEEDDPDTF